MGACSGLFEHELRSADLKAACAQRKHREFIVQHFKANGVQLKQLVCTVYAAAESPVGIPCAWGELVFEFLGLGAGIR